MNFLAHIFLSGENELITLGNFSGDGVRGNAYKKFPLEVQVGILLHREIDTFTDAHPTVRKSTKRLHRYYSHYSSVIVDIFYDHFLAKNWETYATVPLEHYVADFYGSLSNHLNILPERIKRLTPIMIEQNWLLSYAEINGIQSVLNGMNRRTKGKSNMHLATEQLVLFYDHFEKEFTSFFAELIKFSTEKRIELQKTLLA